MKWIPLLLVVLTLVFVFWYFRAKSDYKLEKPTSEAKETKKERPLLKYAIEALSNTQFKPSEITLGEVLAEEGEFTSYKFYFWVDGKKVSGLANIPKSSGNFPVVVMFRGYVERDGYQTGVGTQRAGEVFANSGFATLAPDFLGYGESDMPSDNPIEERFQTYISALTLMESVGGLNETLKKNNIDARVDPLKVGIWGHSNGGQIALTVLEITGKDYPTVLWAPVSKPFPYSVLYYTDEFDDRGKKLRRVIADFEKDYDIELYNLTNYFAEINAPIQIHQGTADDAVPQKWSDQLVDEIMKLEKDVEYFTYPQADHNLLPGWNQAVSRAIEFYRDKFASL